MNDTNVRSYLLDELGDADAPIGSRLWLLYTANEIRKTLYDTQQSGHRLDNLVRSFKEYNGWQEFGYLTWEQYCVERLQATAAKIEDKAKAAIAALANETQPLAVNGANQHTRVGDNNYNTLSFDSPSIQGTSPEYLTARIARDRPDILERMKAGEYKSVRSAAIDAGIIDPEKSKRYSLPADPTAAARYLLTRVDPSWVATFVAELVKAV